MSPKMLFLSSVTGSRETLSIHRIENLKMEKFDKNSFSSEYEIPKANGIVFLFLREYNQLINKN